MEQVILTKHYQVPVDAVAFLLPACKAKLVKQLQLVRQPELDSFGHTAIEEKTGCTSVESYVSTALVGVCSDHFLTVDADGRPLALISGVLEDNGTFIVVMALHDDYLNDNLIEQHAKFGCSRWECHPEFPTDLPQYFTDQGPVDDTEPDDNN